MPNKQFIYLNDIDLNTFFTYFNQQNITNKNLKKIYCEPKVKWNSYKLTISYEGAEKTFFTRYSHKPSLEFVLNPESNTYNLSVNSIYFLIYLFSIGKLDKLDNSHDETIIQKLRECEFTKTNESFISNTLNIEIDDLKNEKENYLYSIPEDDILKHKSIIFEKDDKFVTDEDDTDEDKDEYVETFELYPNYSIFPNIFITPNKIYYRAILQYVKEQDKYYIHYYNEDIEDTNSFTEDEEDNNKYDNMTQQNVSKMKYITDNIVEAFNINNNSIGFIVNNSTVKTDVKEIDVEGTNDKKYVKEYETPYGNIINDCPDLSRFEEYVNAVRTIMYGNDAESILAAGTSKTPYKPLYAYYRNINSISALSKVYDVVLYKELDDDAAIYPDDFDDITYEAHAINWTPYTDTEITDTYAKYAIEVSTIYNEISELLNFDKMKPLEVVQYSVSDMNQKFNGYPKRETIYLPKNRLYDAATGINTENITKIAIYKAYSTFYSDEIQMPILTNFEYDSNEVPKEPSKVIDLISSKHIIHPRYTDEEIRQMPNLADQYYFTIDAEPDSVHPETKQYITINNTNYLVMQTDDGSYYLDTPKKIWLYPFYSVGDDTRSSKYTIYIEVQYKTDGDVAYNKVLQDPYIKDLYFKPAIFEDSYDINYGNISYATSFNYSKISLPELYTEYNLEPLSTADNDYLGYLVKQYFYRDIYTNKIIEKSNYLIIDSNFRDSLELNTLDELDGIQYYSVNKLKINGWDHLYYLNNNLTHPDVNIFDNIILEGFSYNGLEGAWFTTQEQPVLDSNNEEVVNIILKCYAPKINKLSDMAEYFVIYDPTVDQKSSKVSKLYLNTINQDKLTEVKNIYMHDKTALKNKKDALGTDRDITANIYQSQINVLNTQIAQLTETKNNLSPFAFRKMRQLDNMINELTDKKTSINNEKSRALQPINTQINSIEAQLEELDTEYNQNINDLTFINYSIRIYKYDGTNIVQVDPLDTEIAFDPSDKYYLGHDYVVQEPVTTITKEYVYETDENGNSVKVIELDENGDPLVEYDYDDEGNLVALYETDENGNLIPEVDENGDVILDENGDPVYRLKYVYKTEETTVTTIEDVRYYHFLNSINFDLELNIYSKKPVPGTEVGWELSEDRTKFKLFFNKNIGTEEKPQYVKLYINHLKTGLPTKNSEIKNYYSTIDSVLIDKLNNEENRGAFIVENELDEINKKYFLQNLSDLLNDSNETLSLVTSYSPDYLPRMRLWVKALYDIYANELRINNGAYLSFQKFENLGKYLSINKKSIPNRLILHKINDDDTVAIKEVNDDYIDFNQEQLDSDAIIEIDKTLHKESPYTRLLRYQDFPTYGSYRDYLIKSKIYQQSIYNYTDQHIVEETYTSKNDEIQYNLTRNIDIKDKLINLLTHYYYDNMYIEGDADSSDPSNKVSFYLHSYDKFFDSKIQETESSADLLYSDKTFEKTSYPEYVNSPDNTIWTEWADGLLELIKKGWGVN